MYSREELFDKFKQAWLRAVEEFGADVTSTMLREVDARASQSADRLLRRFSEIKEQNSGLVCYA